MHARTTRSLTATTRQCSIAASRRISGRTWNRGATTASGSSGPSTATSLQMPSAVNVASPSWGGARSNGLAMSSCNGASSRSMAAGSAHGASAPAASATRPLSTIRLSSSGGDERRVGR
jgi:hypothetical protein